MKSRKILSATCVMVLSTALSSFTHTPANANSANNFLPENDYPTLISYLTPNQVKQHVNDVDLTLDFLCGIIPNRHASAVCSTAVFGINAAKLDVFRQAAAEGCGVLIKSTPTGSPRSYDKAITEFTKICDESMPVPPPGGVAPYKNLNN